MTRLCGMSPYDPHMPGPGDIWSPPEDDGEYCEYCEHCHAECSCEDECPCPGGAQCQCECPECEQDRADDYGDYLYDEMVDRMLTGGL